MFHKSSSNLTGFKKKTTIEQVDGREEKVMADVVTSRR